MAESAFLACYRCGTGAPGAATLEIKWVVSTPSKTVHGIGILTQATNPPVNLQVPLHGHYDDASRTTVVQAAGGELGGTVSLILELHEGWGKPGECEVVYSANGKYGEHMTGPAQPVEC